jgi:hypothetical protein
MPPNLQTDELCQKLLIFSYKLPNQWRISVLLRKSVKLGCFLCGRRNSSLVHARPLQDCTSAIVVARSVEEVVKQSPSLKREMGTLPTREQGPPGLGQLDTLPRNPFVVRNRMHRH